MASSVPFSDRPRLARAYVGCLYLPLLALALLSAAVAVLLAYSPLNGTPDTYCQTVLSPPDGSGCSEVLSRRWFSIAAALAVAFALGVLALLAHRARDPDGLSQTRTVMAGLLGVGVLLGVTAAGYLAIGSDNYACGSVLSKVDEHGSYASDRPTTCAPAYAADWTRAGITGGVGLAVIAGALGFEIRATGQRHAPT